MSEKFEGVVDWAGGKDFRGNTLYSMKIGEQWFRTGTTNPNVSRGDFVSFEFDFDGKGNNVNMNTFVRKTQEERAPNVVPNNVRAVTRGGGASRKPAYEANDDRQKMISWQAAVNTAIALVNGGISNGYVTIAGRKGDVKYDAYKAMVLQEARDLFRLTQVVPDEYDSLVAAASEVATATNIPTDFSDLDENLDGFTDD